MQEETKWRAPSLIEVEILGNLTLFIDPPLFTISSAGALQEGKNLFVAYYKANFNTPV